jgi:hypothetical protein
MKKRRASLITQTRSYLGPSTIFGMEVNGRQPEQIEWSSARFTSNWNISDIPTPGVIGPCNLTRMNY